MLLPVERGRAVVGEQLLRELLLDRLCELPRDLEVRRARLHPDEVRVRRISKCTRDARVDAVAHAVETFCGAVTGYVLAVALIDVARDQCRGLCIGPRNDERRNTFDVRGETRGVQRLDVLVGRNQHLATEVATLLR